MLSKPISFESQIMRYLTLGLAIAQICVWKFTGEELNMEEFLSDPLIYQLQPGRCSIFAGKE